MTTQIGNAYQLIVDKYGKPLNNGLVYIGESGQNAELYPIQVFYDEDFTIPAPQPLRTVNGYFSRNGSPAKIFIQGVQCSIIVKDKFKILQSLDLNYTGIFSGKGITASNVLDESGKTQQTINDEQKTTNTLITDALNGRYTKAESDSISEALENHINSVNSSLSASISTKVDQTYVDNAIGAISTDASKQYATLALANADIANIELNQNVFISDAVNGGYWYKATANATSLTKSAYDPLMQAKVYSDENRAFAQSVNVSSGAILLTDEQSKKQILYFTGTLTADATVTFPKTVAEYIVENSTSGGFNILLKTLDQAGASVVLKPNAKIQIYNTSASIRTLNLLSVPDVATIDKSDLPANTKFVKESIFATTNITATNAGLTLTPAQLLYPNINLIGTLTAAIDVNIPEIVGQWTFRNGTNGAQVITLKSGAFSVILPVGQTITVYKPTNTTIFRTDGDKAPLANPVFSGIPTVPTAPAGTNNTQAASTLYSFTASHGGLSIPVSDDITLTTAQAGVKTLTFTGTLTKDITITVPFPTGDWNVRNNTTGGFNIRFKSANPPVAIIPAGESRGCFANASSMNMLPVGIQTVPIASGAVAGLVKVGNGLTVDAQGLISVDGGGGVEISSRTISVLNTTTVAGASTPSARQMSDDGMICFGIESRYLKISFDWGKTWPAGSIYDSGTGTVINWVHETDDGQLLCVVRTTATNNQALYKSTNWQRKNQTLTWTKVHEIEKPGVSLNGYWGFSKYRNIMLCAEYGAKVGVQTQNMPPEGAEPGMNARYVYMSKDNGDTWATIFDVNAVTDGEGVHIHGVAFDEYWNRIWVSHGDGFRGTNGLYYSDDFGTTWVSALETQNKGVNFSQTVHIVPMKTCVLFASDSYPNGIHRIDRAQGKNPTQGWYDIDTTAYLLEDQLEQLNYLCHSVSQPKFLPDMPVTFAFGAETQTGYSQVVATFDGWTFFPLWKDPVISAVGQGARSVIGPTYENEIIIHCTNPDRASSWERTTLKVAVE